MRRSALVACACLLGLSIAVRMRWSQAPAVSPLDCPRVVMIDTAKGSRLACDDDPTLASCGPLRAGLRYRGCEPVGVVPGALLAARGLPIDLALAGETDLRALPGIGPGLARRIVEGRTRGPFCRIDDLGRVPGLGDKRRAALANRVSFHDPRCPLIDAR
jgi:hypothetical protein